MSENNKAIDPIGDLSSVMPPNIKGEMFKQEIDETRFCRLHRQKGHSECNPWDELQKLLKRMVELDLGRDEMVPGLKGTPMTWAYYLYSKLYHLKCDSDEYRSYEPDLGSTEQRAATLLKMMNDAGVPKKGVAKMVTELPVFHYVAQNRLYCVQASDGQWHLEGKEDAIDRLGSAGISAYSKGGDLSDADRELLRVRNENVVDLMMPLAGYAAGRYEINGYRILVPSSFKLIEPDTTADGGCAHVRALLNGLLNTVPTDADGNKIKGAKEDQTQLNHFLAHLQNSYRDLAAGHKSGSMAVFLVGPKDCGKSLLLNLVVVPLLGDRFADVYLYISGQTSFNDELIRKEVWILDDAPPPSDPAARRRQAGVVKQAVAAGHVAGHGKGLAQVSVALYRRLFVALNEDELENLPMFSEALSDKFMLLKCKSFKMPEDCLPLPVREKQDEFKAQVRSELPAFLGWLMDQDFSKYADRRFGVKPIKDAELMAKNAEASGLDVKYALICKELFTVMDRDAVEIKASALYLKLMSSKSNAEAARAVFRNPQSLGLALRELKESATWGPLVSVRLLDGIQRWTIKQEPAVLKEINDRLKPRRSATSSGT